MTIVILTITVFLALIVNYIIDETIAYPFSPRPMVYLSSTIIIIVYIFLVWWSLK